MASSLDFSDRSLKDNRKAMENSNFSVLEIPGAGAEEDFQSMDKDRGKNAKQFTWVLLLKAHRAAGCVAWFAAVLWAILGAIKERLILKKGVCHEKASKDHFLLNFIRVFLVLSLITLAFELIAYWNGWHYLKPDLHLLEPLDIQGWLYLAYISWLSFRADYIAYPIQIISNICKVLFIIQSADRLVQCLGCFWIKFKKIKPRIEGDPFKPDDGSEHVYPKVLVQIPMCNEKEVYQQSISAACQLDWPNDCLLIQVLDDSDDETIQQLIKEEVAKWSQRGVNVVYQHRLERTGYKAGNLRSGMSCDYVKNYEFVAIFDADFQPNLDFLKLTVPHFKGDPELGLVQARWSFVNKDENLITRLQNINMCFHFEVEQQVNGHFWNFFGFNGTAGVWRIKALEDSGGWLDRTTVEDMDIAVRAHIRGWKFILLNDVKVPCEVPESFEAYMKQQHRWHSGPMNLFRLCLPDIMKSKISIWKKANLILLFFLLRKLILPFYCFTLLCVILPLTMFVPEAELPVWLIFYMPLLMSLLNVLPAPRSFPYIVPYLLFENTMSVTKFDAMVSGLLQLGSSYQWIVTKKAGRQLASIPSSTAEKGPKKLSLTSQHKETSENELPKTNQVKEQKEKAAPVKKANKIYKKELALALLLLTAAARSLLSARIIHFYVLLFQGVSFLVVGLDMVSERMV